MSSFVEGWLPCLRSVPRTQLALRRLDSVVRFGRDRAQNGQIRMMAGAAGKDRRGSSGEAAGDSSGGVDKYDIPVTISPKGHGTVPAKEFSDLQSQVHPSVYSNLMRYRFERLSPVQAHCIPLLLAGKDVMACAQTGSGKTLMFLVPAISSVLRLRESPARTRGEGNSANPHVLVLAPTRELAQQIHEEALRLSAGTSVRSVCAFGGEATKVQSRELANGCDVLIATPGRLQMFIERGQVSLRSVSFLVVDEADRMLDMGFEPQLQFIVRRLGPVQTRRNLMCSATFPEDIQYLAANFLTEDYYFVAVGRIGSTTELITQNFQWVEDKDKPRALLDLLKSRGKADRRTLVFINTKADAQVVGRLLHSNGIRSEEIHGDRSQENRQDALRRFKSGRIPVLVATDVAARGLDVAGVDHVIQYDTAKDSDGYTHRIGRTGRAGEKGTATAFMNARQKGSASSILRQLREVGQTPPTWLLGMSNVAQKEHEVLVNSDADGGSELDVPADAAFGGQDFRKTAKRGTWGAQKDLNFASFDEKAYTAGTESASDREDGADGDEHADLVPAGSSDEGGTDDGEERELAADAESLEGEEAVHEGGESAEEEDALSTEERKRTALRNFRRPQPSVELLDLIRERGFRLREEPDQRVERFLQSHSKQMYFEYMGLFPVELIETYQSRFKESTESMRKVLMVAEKPSVAEAIATILSRGRFRKRRGLGRNVPVFEFSTQFPVSRERVLVRVTSVVGHVFSLGFKEESMKENWRRNPLLLFDCETIKQVESTSDKLRIVEHLQNEAVDCSYLALWLDCDREGENIAHEVISVTRDTFSDDAMIYRARFSALTAVEIEHAFRNLVRPNANESMAVDARQELDLKVGVAFSRLLTNSFARLVREKFSNDTKLLSYGPCQSPTLFFCVQRYKEIASFERTPYWVVRVRGNAGVDVVLRWSKESTLDETEARRVEGEINRNRVGRVTRVRTTTRTMRRPDGLNTVQLLVACSKSLGISPKKTMTVAEKLYTAGFLSYPRTETTQYPPSMDIAAVLREHRNHPNWGRTVDYLLRRSPTVPQGGKQVGDHPPITPTRAATREVIGGGLEWRIYEFVTRHFLGSLMDDIQYRELDSDVQVGGLHLTHKQIVIDQIGFGGAMTWNLQDIYRADEEFRLRSENEGPRSTEVPKLRQGDPLQVVKVKVVRKETEPPLLLQEHELVKFMDTHGIGTDASMAGHISTIVDRNYVVVCDKEGVPVPVGGRPPGQKGGRRPAGGRFMVPTSLGIGVIEGFLQLDDQLVLPEIRAMMEREVASIAEGALDKKQVVDENLAWFAKRFVQFRDRLQSMERLLRSELKPTRVHLRTTREFFPAADDAGLDSRSPSRERGSRGGGRGRGRPPAGGSTGFGRSSTGGGGRSRADTEPWRNGGPRGSNGGAPRGRRPPSSGNGGRR